MTIQHSTLRPGLLVSLKTSVRGNVTYNKRDLEIAHETDDGSQVAVWETQRVVADAAEHEAAKTARGKASSLIRRVCAQSAFGLLCPEQNAAELEAAIADARRVCEEFNKTAVLSRVSIYVICGRIAPNDVEAVKAINSEVRDLLETMKSGIENCDVKVIRDAASQARNLGQMLNPDAQSRIQVAIDAVRSSARQIVKAGEAAAVEVDQRTLRTLAEVRTAFLDLDEGGEVAAPAAVARSVDFESDAPKGLIDSAADSADALRKARAGLLAPGPQFEIE